MMFLLDGPLGLLQTLPLLASLVLTVWRRELRLLCLDAFHCSFWCNSGGKYTDLLTVASKIVEFSSFLVRFCIIIEYSHIVTLRSRV